MSIPGQTCGPCLATPPVHDGVRAAVAYGGIASELAIRLKHGRKTGLAPIMAQAMHRAAGNGDDMLIPVPLHRWRIWRRGFNQSAVLARQVSVLSGVKVLDDVIIRHRATPSLAGAGPKQRQKAVSGAFRIVPEHKALLKGARIGLIDDVFTTGATASACAAVLKRAGAERVRVICWARVVRKD